MKTKTYYELWICYGHNKWHDLKRAAETEHRARHIAEEIAKEHTKSTHIAVVKVELKKDTGVVYSGTSTILKPRQMRKCHECGKRRNNSNINSKTGVCITCEMRNEVNRKQPLLTKNPEPVYRDIMDNRFDAEPPYWGEL
jgi:hypothetical protein